MADKISLRISSGKLGGRWLESPVSRQLRPTRDVVRAALFDMLYAIDDVADKTVFDLFCGSGALGIEAYSRGAKHVTLVDNNIRPAKQNLEALDLPRGVINLVRNNVFTYKPKHKPDLILADPPYDLQYARKLLSQAGQYANSGTLWAVETEASEKLDKFMADELPGKFEILRDRVHGINRLWVLRQN